MYIELPCAKCAKTLKISEEHLGRKIRCPYCRQTQIPQLIDPSFPTETADPLNFLEQLPAGKQEPAAGTGARGPQLAPAKSPAKKPQPSPQPSQAQQSPRPQSQGQQETSNGTDVSAVKTGLIGFAAFFLIYLVLYPLQNWFIGQLLWQRGWVQFAETFLATWAGAILVFKARQLTVERDSMLFDLLPEEISHDITPDKAGQFLAHIRGLPIRGTHSFLVNRVLRGLEHFGVLKSNSEAANRLASQSEIDSNAITSSYMLVKVFVWAIPILGFIGTVMGIGQAVGAFSATMSAASDMSALKESFNSVTGGLATAFDTTLLALVLSMFIMFPMSSLQKGELDLLNWVDEYCNENLLKRLKGVDGGGNPTVDGMIDGKQLQAAIDAALVPHHAELRAWGKRLEGLGESLGQQVAKGWNEIDQKLQEHHGKAVAEMTKSIESYRQLTERLRTQSEEQATAMTELVRQTQSLQKGVAGILRDSSEAIATAGDSIQRYFAAMERGLSSLNSVLASLGERQVVVQNPRRKRRLFGLFG